MPSISTRRHNEALAALARSKAYVAGMGTT